jgi:trigger factor
VTLGEYKGLHADKKKWLSLITKSNTRLNISSKTSSLVVKEEAAVLGDTVVMNFEGFVDGQPFEGGKAENHSLELGSGQFIPGFEDALVGVKAGDEKDVNVTFPTEYTPELAGKAATFKVKVHEVKVKKVPELNEELIKDLNLPNVKTIEDLKAHQKAKLESQKANDVKRDYYEALVKQIRDNAKIDLAKEIIDGEVEAMEENMLKQIEQQGLTMEKYLQITGQTHEKLHEQMAKEADDTIRSVLVLERLRKSKRLPSKKTRSNSSWPRLPISTKCL